MGRKKPNIHYLYKTTCNVTGRWYIGMHSTSNLDDGYMGSGKRLRYSIRKYGVDNHIKEILEFFDSRELLIEAEKKAITPDMIGDDMCMNLKPGGYGGLNNEEHYLKFVLAGINNFNQNRDKMNFILKEKRKDSDWLEICNNKISKSLKKYYEFNDNVFKGKTHSEESKQLISESMRGKGKGETNSQYGTCWITKEGENKKIKKEDLDEWLEQGWNKGRK